MSLHRHPNLISRKRQVFMSLVRQTMKLRPSELCNIVSNKGHTLLQRQAALRSLICTASLEVTQGRCYASRRRLVRKHFNV